MSSHQHLCKYPLLLPPQNPQRPIQRSENVDKALQFLQKTEGIKYKSHNKSYSACIQTHLVSLRRLVNISALDIVDGKASLILGLVWTLSMP